MKKKFNLKGIWQVLKASGSGFSSDKITKLSASLAYYTVFSMGPLLIVIIFLCSLFFKGIENTIYGQLKGFIGADAAGTLQDIIKNAAISGKGPVAATIGIVTLLIGATTVFGEIQDSINTIWGLKPKPKKSWVKLIINRLLSFGVIASLGFLLLVSLAITTILDGFSDRLKNFFPDVTVVVFYIINLVITLCVITMLFGVIFKVLPDARIRWKDVLAGAVTTAFLFMVGKFGISLYISKSNVGTTYGTAGSFVILLLWIYYSSIILYFGAEFTKAYAIQYGAAIHPNDYAVTTQVIEVETGKKTIQQNDKHNIEVAPESGKVAATSTQTPNEPKTNP